MTGTLKDLWDSQIGLNILLEDTDLHIVAKHRLSLLIPELERLGERHLELINRYGTGNGSGIVSVLSDSEHYGEFSQQFQELLSEPIPSFRCIELSKLSESKLNAIHLASLSWLIIEDDLIERE